MANAYLPVAPMTITYDGRTVTLTDREVFNLVVAVGMARRSPEAIAAKSVMAQFAREVFAELGVFGEQDTGKSLLVKPIARVPAADVFTPTHAHVVHQAMVEAKHEAKERREKMPSSADALERRAAELLTVRNMILDRLPEEFHSHRLAYPDYIARL